MFLRVKAVHLRMSCDSKDHSASPGFQGFVVSTLLLSAGVVNYMG